MPVMSDINLCDRLTVICNSDFILLQIRICIYLTGLKGSQINYKHVMSKIKIRPLHIFESVSVACVQDLSYH